MLRFWINAIVAVFAIPKAFTGHYQSNTVATVILTELAGWAGNVLPVVINTCDNFVEEVNALHVARIHRRAAFKKAWLIFFSARTASVAINRLQSVYATYQASTVRAGISKSS